MLNTDNAPLTDNAPTISDILTDNSANTEPTEKKNSKGKKLPYLAGINSTVSNSLSINAIDSLLEKEMALNKTQPWNKLDKTVKMNKLTSYTEKYGVDNNLSSDEMETLKSFFLECLNNGKLQKNKDVEYNKDTQTLTSVVALHFNPDKKRYTLRNINPKRVSTLKSLG